MGIIEIFCLRTNNNIHSAMLQKKKSVVEMFGGWGEEMEEGSY